MITTGTITGISNKGMTTTDTTNTHLTTGLECLTKVTNNPSSIIDLEALLATTAHLRDKR